MTTALYRRYRPQDFSEVIGQEHVTDPLMQALRSGRIGHAYLFSGPRGCGKTTSARILARCLNCEQGPTATPCGECESCRALATGGSGSVDVIEIDAASHGGVDDARDLREKAAYGPAQSRYKVYIIDEAHMVTPQGFNALLKIVEEPPEHVKFVFATTEPEKVIGTIRSRTHHYPFRLVPPARLQDYLEELCAREKVAVEPGVLSFVVRAGGGSVRDSLSVLDQLIAGSDERGLTYAGAAALLGFTEGELLDACVDAIAAGDGAGMFRQIDRVIETGQDPRRFVEDLLERFRDLIVLAAVSQSSDPDSHVAAVLRGLPDDQITRMRQQAGVFGPGQLSYAADIVNAGLTEMTGATSPRLQLELICARLLLPTGAGERGYAARIDRLERRLDVGGGIAVPLQDPAVPGGSAPAAGSRETPTEPASRGGGAPQGWRGEKADQPSAAERPEPPATRPKGAEPAQNGPGGEGRSRPPRTDGQRASTGPEATRPSAQQPAPQARPTGGGRGGVDTEMIRRNWPDVLQRIYGIRRVTWTFLSEHAQVLDYDGTRLLLGLSTKGLATTFRNGPHSEVVRQALSEALGIDTRVEGIPASDAPGGGYAGGSGGAPGGGQGMGPRAGAAPAAPARRESEPQSGSVDATDPRVAHGRHGADAPQSSSQRESSAVTPPRETTPPTGGDAAGQGPGRGHAPRVADTAQRPAQGAPHIDDRPPPSDDDVPPDEESLPPDPGFQRRADAADSTSNRAGGRPEPAQNATHNNGGAGDIGSAPDPAPERRHTHPGAAQAREAIRAARRGAGRATSAAGTAGAAGAGASAGAVTSDADDASVDDEDINDAGAVGQPVIADILGGVVISEQEG